MGPHEFPTNLNGDLYLDFLQHHLVDYLDDLPLNTRQNLFFMQDGAPPHYFVGVRNYLDQIFPDRWIGRGSRISWPPRSPDFNPMDFCFWGYMKSVVYNRETTNTREELWQKIVNAADSFRNKNLYFKIRQSFNKRVNKCIEVGGGHFEHLL